MHIYFCNLIGLTNSSSVRAVFFNVIIMLKRRSDIDLKNKQTKRSVVVLGWEAEGFWIKPQLQTKDRRCAIASSISRPSEHCCSGTFEQGPESPQILKCPLISWQFIQACTLPQPL